MYDDEAERIIELASEVPRKPAWMIQEELGSSRSVRRIQEIINVRLGRRPSRESFKRRDVVRDRVVAYMESQGLSQFWCYNCHRFDPGGCFIHELNKSDDLDSLVFTCRHCASPADR